MELDPVSNPGVSLVRTVDQETGLPEFRIYFNDGDPGSTTGTITGRAVVNVTATGSGGTTVYKLDITYTTLAEIEIEISTP